MFVSSFTIGRGFQTKCEERFPCLSWFHLYLPCWGPPWFLAPPQQVSSFPSPRLFLMRVSLWIRVSLSYSLNRSLYSVVEPTSSTEIVSMFSLFACITIPVSPLPNSLSDTDTCSLEKNSRGYQWRNEEVQTHPGTPPGSMLQAAPQGGRSNLWGRPETGHLQSLTESPPKYLLMTGVLLTNVQNFLDILSSRRWTLILLFFKCNLNSVTHLLGTEDGKGKREIL